MKLIFKRGQKGLTLVELMVVMAIITVLSSIVIPAVTGTKQVSTDTQVRQDASSVETAVHQYNADAQGAESLTADNRTSVLGQTVMQYLSTKWAEVALTTNYGIEFPENLGTSAGSVSEVTILDNDEYTTELYSTDNGTLSSFVNDYTAIDVTALVGEGYLEEDPYQFDSVFSTSKPYHNYLWLTKKDISSTSSNGNNLTRAVQVFKLTKIEVQTDDSSDALTYMRIY